MNKQTQSADFFMIICQIFCEIQRIILLNSPIDFPKLKESVSKLKEFVSKLKEFFA